MNKLSIILLTSFLALMISSCSDTVGSSEDEGSTEQVLGDLNDPSYLLAKGRVDSVWALIDSTEEDLRITANRIVQEVKWSGKGNASAISAVEKQIKELDQYKYKQTSIPKPEQLDEDFAAVDEILSNVVELANSLPNREQYLIIDDLIADIHNYQSNTFTTLINSYNIAVFEHNRVIREKGIETKLLPAYMEDPANAL